MVVHRVAVGDGADHGVVYEFGVGVEVLECRQFLLLGQFLSLFGIARDLHGKGQYLEIEVVGFVHGCHERLFRRDHVVGARLEVGEQRLDDLYTK